jgi:C-terminal processing protease CtpA/Prc
LLDEPFRYFRDIQMNGLAFDWLRYAEDSYRSGASDSLPAEIAALAVRWRDGRYHLIKRPNWGVQRPAVPGFRGPVYVLINGNSFSTSAEFASIVWSHRRAQFVGEEGSGYWRGNTSGPDPTLTLPATRLRLTVPLVEFDMAVRDTALGAHGIKPDHEVTYTVQDLIAGVDKDTAVALVLARQALSPATKAR